MKFILVWVSMFLFSGLAWFVIFKIMCKLLGYVI